MPESGQSCIDGDIIFKDGLFYLFYKTEGHGDGIRLATTESLTSGIWDEKEGYKQQTEDAVEGSSVFKMIKSDVYILMYDVYNEGRYEFCTSTDLENFTLVDQDKISMDFTPRHGSVIPTTSEELQRLFNKWGEPENFNP